MSYSLPRLPAALLLAATLALFSAACDDGQTTTGAPLAAAPDELRPIATVDPSTVLGQGQPAQQIVGIELLASRFVRDATLSIAFAQGLERPACSKALPTTQARIDLALNAGATIRRGTFDPAHPWATVHHSVPMVLFGGSGQCHVFELYLRRVDTTSWSWWLLTDGRELVAGTPDEAVVVGEGRLSFDDAGGLRQQYGSEVSYHLKSLVRPRALTLDFTGTQAVTGPNTTRGVSFDGCYAAGSEACL